MRVLIIGGYGLIGSYASVWLHRHGHEVVVAGRDRDAARRLTFAAWRLLDLARLRKVEDWLAHLEGIDAVVNCAGALQDSPRDNLRAVHVEGPTALYQACVAIGIRRIVHISAASVEQDRATLFNATKFEAETALRQLPAEWIILRPGLVLAPIAYGGTALLRGLAAFPCFIPAVHAGSLVQVVSVEDVAEAIARCLADGAPAQKSYDLVADELLRLDDVLRALRRWLGLPPAPVWNLPPIMAAASARIADALALLGWRSPLRSTSVAQLRMGILGDAAAVRRDLRLEPLLLAEILARWPAGVQEKWFAKLYFIKPLALATLVVFWFVSGTLGLLQQDRAMRVLTEAGCPIGFASLVVTSGALLDIALALLACLRRAAKAGLIGMVLTSLAYMAGGSIFRPDLWVDPLGPLVKILPGAMLALAVLAVMDER